MTNESKSPPFWPFLLMDGLFLGLAVLLWQQGHRPLAWWEMAGLVLCAAAGAAVFLTPFLCRSASTRTLAQAQKLADTAEKIQKLDELAGQISQATAQWQTVQETAAKTAQTATDLAQSMAAEARAFTEFLQKANDAERGHLRLEAEKLRRNETEWVQIVVRMLDQVHALFQAAAHSGQPGLMEQVGQFQNVCRDISRRAGLAAMMAAAGEAFDPKRHQTSDGGAVTENAVILDTVLPGYTYQGQLVRRAVVRVQDAPSLVKGAEKD